MNYRLISILTILFFLSGCSVIGGGQDTKKLVADGLTPKELYEKAEDKAEAYYELMWLAKSLSENLADEKWANEVNRKAKNLSSYPQL